MGWRFDAGMSSTQLKNSNSSDYKSNALITSQIEFTFDGSKLSIFSPSSVSLSENGTADLLSEALGEGFFARMNTPGTPLSFSDVLRLRPVRRLWIAQIVSVFGDFLAVFAIIAVVTFKLHGTATQVAMVLVSFMAPLAIVSPLLH